MEELSLVISAPSDGKFLQAIGWNKDEFMDVVAGMTEKYRGLAYTDDEIKDAKQDRADLNAMKKKISDRRIEIKNAVMQPYMAFEREVNEVIAKIDEPLAAIDAQIKEYESRKRGEKLDSIKEFFQENVGDLEPLLGFDKIFDKKWLNTNVSMKKAREEVLGKIEMVRSAMSAIDGTCDENHRGQVKASYMRNLSLTEALEEYRRAIEIEERQKEAERERAKRERAEAEKREREAAERAAEDARRAAQAVPAPIYDKNPADTGKDALGAAAEATEASGQPAVQPAEQETPWGGPAQAAGTQPEAQEPVAEAAGPAPAKKIYRASFTVYGTKEELVGLKNYMDKHGIRYGKVEK